VHVYGYCLICFETLSGFDHTVVSSNCPIVVYSFSHLILNITWIRWSAAFLQLLNFGCLLEFGCFTAFSLPASFFAKIFIFAKFSRKYENENFRFNPSLEAGPAALFHAALEALAFAGLRFVDTFALAYVQLVSSLGITLPCRKYNNKQILAFVNRPN
jgi:hypothetical protein